MGGRGVEWVAGRMGSHRRAKANMHTNTNGSAMTSVGDPDWHNS